MNFIRKKWWVPAFGMVALAITLAYAANYPHRLTVAGTEIWRIDTDGSVQSQGSITLKGALQFGDNETGSSATVPTTATAVNFANKVPVYNVGATALTAGDVLIASNTGTGYVAIQPGTLDLTTIVGVAAESIASGAKGWMIPRGGGFSLVKTTGTVAIGDILVSTPTAAGRAGTDATPTTGADFATAMSAGAAAGDTVLAILH